MTTAFADPGLSAVAAVSASAARTDAQPLDDPMYSSAPDPRQTSPALHPPATEARRCGLGLQQDGTTRQRPIPYRATTSVGRRAPASAPRMPAPSPCKFVIFPYSKRTSPPTSSKLISPRRKPLSPGRSSTGPVTSPIFARFRPSRYRCAACQRNSGTLPESQSPSAPPHSTPSRTGQRRQVLR